MLGLKYLPPHHCKGGGGSDASQSSKPSSQLVGASGASSISSLSQSSRPSLIKKNKRKTTGKRRSSPRNKGNRKRKKTTSTTTKRRILPVDDKDDDDDDDDDGCGDKDEDDDDDDDADDDDARDGGKHGKRDDTDFLPVTALASDEQDMLRQRMKDQKNAVLQKLIARHREVFIARAFPTLAEDGEDYMLWCRPQQELNYIIHVLSNWRVGVSLKAMTPGQEKENIANFRRKNKLGNKYIKKYTLEKIQVPGQDPTTVVRRIEKNRQVGRIVVSRETVFDAIDEWHRYSGHLGQERTWTFCATKYYNVSQPLVKVYCETCFTCAQKNPVTRPQKGSRKPILSRLFRQRFQIDLVDMRKLRKRDPFGVMMRWIMTVKDHATGFTYICALPCKRPSLVAYRLQDIFGVIGYPTIFHTDNGKEFTAKVILQFLRQLNPNILTVTGHPRRPNDQGSVESMNKLVKRVLNSVLAERRAGGENPNWTEVLGTVSASVNSRCGRGKHDVPSFNAVFGMPYDQDFSCSKEEARRCWTLPERLMVCTHLFAYLSKIFVYTSSLTHHSWTCKVTNDPEFAEYASNAYNLEDTEDACDEDDSGYFSDGELSKSEEVEVTDEYFYDHLLDDNHDEERKVSRPPWDGPTHPLATPEKDAVRTLSNMQDHSNDSPESSVAQLVTDHPNTYKLGTNAVRCSIDEAWKFYADRNSTAECVNCRLQCEVCQELGALGIPILDDNAVDRFRTSDEWYGSDFIAGFCTLVAHDAHCDDTPQAPYRNDHRIMMVYCPYPSGDIKEVLPIQQNATHFVSVVFNAGHFAVLYYDIMGRTVSVFDGLNWSITNWEKHIVRTIKEYGLKPLSSQVKSEFSTQMHEENDVLLEKMILHIDFDDGEAPWIVENERQYKQRDGHNCGPIAILKVLQVYGWIRPGAIELIAKTPLGYRGFTMNFYQDIVKKYNDSLSAELRLHLASNNEIMIHPVVDKDQADEVEPMEQLTEDDAAEVEKLLMTEEVGMMENDPAPTDSVADGNDVMENDPTTTADSIADDNDVEVPTEDAEEDEALEDNQSTDVIRAKSMEKRNMRQEANAMKAMKLFGKQAINEGAAIGAIVALKVDYRTVSQPNGLLGVVYDVKELTGGILVCCEHGVITHSGTKGDYWVPYNMYKIIARRDQNIPLTDALQALRIRVLMGQYVAEGQKRISYAKLHDAVIQSSSPIKRGKGCSCRKECKKSCGCKKNGFQCHSGCFCNGNCEGN